MRIKLFLLSIIISLNLSAKVEISILTTTPGTEAHTLFGHTAIRVVDEVNDLDKVFNYGLFDFKTPNFLFRIVKGDLDYWLGVQTIEKFIALNNREKRFIQEQKLDLTDRQAITFFADLVEESKSENKFYRYSFTKKNCATEPADLLIKYGFIGGRESRGESYRDLLNRYMGPVPWARFGINLILGTNVEEEMSWEDGLFLPDHVKTAVDASPGLVSETLILNEFEPVESSSFMNFITSPISIFSLIAIISFFCRPKWLKILLFFFIAVIGCFITFNTLTTYHVELQNNLNVLWANPLYILLVFAMLFKKGEKYLIYAILGCLGLALFVQLFGIQSYDYQAIPLVMALVVFMFDHLKKLKTA
ncbi:MAG: hypothetical protein ACI857_002937 [Arenicella sp.]|jgi:hypothetical protein